jgi:hypothetical protein
MERFDYQHLDGFTIESAENALRIDYSEPDQGGTHLLIRFRIPMYGNPETETGYSHEQELRRKEITLEEIPSRVIADAETWLLEQREIAESQGKEALVKALSNFRERVGRK